jgi:Chain length determinant protein
MSEQSLDLRRSLQLVRRHKIVVGIFTALGLLVGVGYAAHNPPMHTSNALVALPPSVRDQATQVVVVSSDRVLRSALHSIHPAMSLRTLRSRVQVRSVTSNLLSISAQGKTAAQAEGTANAVANSYVSYVRTPKSAAGRVQAQVLELATSASGTSLAAHLLVSGALGALAGLLIGAIVALAISRGDRRLREREEIADSIGVPVLASIHVGHLSDTASWTKLFEEYEPGAVDEWRMRQVLRQLGFAGLNLTDLSAGRGCSIGVLSLSSDRKALALGPQLAVFTASLGVPTAFVVGPQQDVNAVATLRAACDAPRSSSRRSGNLRITVSDQYEAPDRLPGAGLVIVATVVNGQTPQVAETMRTSTTVLGVSAGAATAEQLARVAASAAANDRHLAGILVADPDPADHTTGRLPQLARSTQRTTSAHIDIKAMETRR